MLPMPLPLPTGGLILAGVAPRIEPRVTRVRLYHYERSRVRTLAAHAAGQVTAVRYPSQKSNIPRRG